MDVQVQARRIVNLIGHRTSLTIDGARFFRLPQLGRFPRRDANRIDYHNHVAEWIGTSRMIHAKPGAPFGKPAYVGTGVFWKRQNTNPEWLADTKPKRKSLDAQRAGVAPNPGRPELGGVVRDQ